MPRSARTEGFSRRHRFTARGSFAPVLRSPRKIRGRLAVLHVMPSPTGRSRLGIGLTRRLVATSVDRNRLKRVIREAFRTHPARAAGFDCVVMLRERFAPGDDAAIRDEVRGFLDRLCAGESRP